MSSGELLEPYISDLLDNSTIWGSAYGSYLKPAEPGSGGGSFGYQANSYAWFTYDPGAGILFFPQ